MKIGVLGGSFNPPTLAHIEISKASIKEGFCDRVIWVPVNDAYKKSTNIESKHRLAMVDLALQDEEDIDYSLIEFKQNDKIIRTFDTLSDLQERYPNDEIIFIAGADKLVFKWMQRRTFLSKFGYILINRGNIDCNNVIKKSDVLSQFRDKIHIINYKSDISSTIVRNEIKENKHSSLITQAVEKYILDNHLYE